MTGFASQPQGFRSRIFAGSNRRVWLIWLFCVVGTLVTAILYYLNQPVLRGLTAGPIVGLAFTLSYSTLGAIIVINRPRNPIGWLLLGLATAATVVGFAIQYSVYGLVTVAPHMTLGLGREDPRQLIGARFMGWLQSWGQSIYFPALVALPYLLYPNGKLPSRRWRPAIWLVVFAVTLSTLSVILEPGPIYNYAGSQAIRLPMNNPTGVTLPSWISDAMSWGWGLSIMVVMISLFAPISRYRKAKGTERQQLKWFVYFASIFLVLFFIFGGGLGEAGLGIIVLIPPVAAAIAIVQYRLYDIDLIINRTLVYGSITAILAVTYLASVAVLQSIISRVTGQQSSIAIVATTLIIAALFQPLRRRVQSFVDRRFYRRKYNMERTLAEFGASLRDDVDQDALSDSLLSAITEAIQPEHLSLWLRDIRYSRSIVDKEKGADA